MDYYDVWGKLNAIINNCYHQSVTEDVISEDKYLYLYVADETQPCTTLSDLVILVPSYLFLSLSWMCMRFMDTAVPIGVCRQCCH